jgi:hypothetical protein
LHDTLDRSVLDHSAGPQLDKFNRWAAVNNSEKTLYLRAEREVPIVRKYRPQNDHVERSDLAKRFFIAGWERERAERAERGREGQGLKYPSVGLSMIWLVRILWFMLIGGWGRRRVQARLEAGL